MDAATLRALQAPLKQKYREDPASARTPARAAVTLHPAGLSAVLQTRPSSAGLHAATGGTGAEACSADILLEALAACAAVTLMAVATAMECPVTGGRVIAEGIWDARGTLGVDRSVPVGLQDISLRVELQGALDEATRQRLLQLTERYCVILATLRTPPTLTLVASVGQADALASA
jgi:uncharacterized OsmC-like protein